MIERLRAALPEGNRRYPFRYRRMVNVIADRMAFLRSRYLFAKPVATPGMMLLRVFITNLNLPALDKYSSDVERYTEVIKFFKDNYLQTFDPVATGNIRYGRFISAQKLGGLPPPEIILNSECADPLLTLPFEKPWEDWQELRAVRFIYHNSLELPEDYTTSMLDYKFDKPEFLVISLDVPILLFKYYKYWKSCGEAGVKPDINEFLKQYEYSHFIADLYDIWIFNLLTVIFSKPDATVEDILGMIHVPKRIATENILRFGIEGAREFITLVKNGVLKPQDFLETKWFYEMSIEDRMAQLDKWVQLPMRHAYLWERTLVWLPYLNFLTTLLDFFPEGITATVIRERGREIYVKNFKYVRMAAVNNSEKLSAFIEKLKTQVDSILNTKGLVDA